MDIKLFCCVGTWKNLGLKLRLQRRSRVTNGAHFEMTHLKNVKNAANFGRLNSCLMTFNFGLGTRIQNNFPWSPEESFIKVQKWLYSKWSLHGKIIWKRKLLTWIFILDIVLWAFSFFIILIKWIKVNPAKSYKLLSMNIFKSFHKGIRNIEKCTKNTIRITAVSRIKQPDFSLQKWPTIEMKSNLPARQFKIRKSLWNRVLLPVKRISYF